MSKAVTAFPEAFGGSYKANIQKASRWWKTKDVILKKDPANPRYVTSRQPGLRRQLNTKAGPGRGRKRPPWSDWLQLELLSEFERLRAAGLKFDITILVSLAKELVINSPNDFNADYSDPSDGKSIISKITYNWALRFVERFNIVQRSQCGKKMVSPAKREYLAKTIAFHLGVVSRLFQSGALDENCVENIDETHFVVNMDNGRTLGFVGDDCTRYAEVVSGGDGMTMIVRITGGEHALIEVPFMVFTNKNRSYPIRGVPDNIPGVCYRSSPKGFVDMKLFAEYFNEPRAQRCRHYAERTIFLDNYSGHNESSDLLNALEKLKAALRFLPAGTTEYTQPADSFVIQKIKQHWTNAWHQKKMELIRENGWQDKVRADGSWSGALKHPGKAWFLKLAAESVRAVNAQRDKNGLTYARKSMIRCGLSKDVDGVWRIEQLFPALQNIIAKHRNHFDGEAVPLPQNELRES